MGVRPWDGVAKALWDANGSRSEMGLAAEVFEDLNDQPLPVPEPFWVEVMEMFSGEGEEGPVALRGFR